MLQRLKDLLFREPHAEPAKRSVTAFSAGHCTLPLRVKVGPAPEFAAVLETQHFEIRASQIGGVYDARKKKGSRAIHTEQELADPGKMSTIYLESLGLNAGKHFETQGSTFADKIVEVMLSSVLMKLSFYSSAAELFDVDMAREAVEKALVAGKDETFCTSTRLTEEDCVSVYDVCAHRCTALLGDADKLQDLIRAQHKHEYDTFYDKVRTMIRPYRTVRRVGVRPRAHATLVIVENGKLYHFDPHGSTVRDVMKSFCLDVCSDPAMKGKLEYGGNAFTLNQKCANQNNLQGSEPFCVLWCCSLAFVLCINPHLSLVQVMDYFTLKTPDARYLQQKVYHFSRFLFEYMIKHVDDSPLGLPEGFLRFVLKRQQKELLRALRRRRPQATRKIALVAPPPTAVGLGKSAVADYYFQIFAAQSQESMRVVDAIWAKVNTFQADEKAKTQKARALVDKLWAKQRGS